MSGTSQALEGAGEDLRRVRRWRNIPLDNEYVRAARVISNSLPCLTARSGRRVFRSSSHTISSVVVSRTVCVSSGGSMNVSLEPAREFV